jgi:uncharacterized protein YfaS (alpha-2-macroglobulin family)
MHHNPQEHARLTTFVLIALTLAAVACNLPGAVRGTAEPQAIPPTPTVDVSTLPPTTPKVIAQRPYPGEELPLDGSIDIYFDQPMDQGSVEEALHIEPAVDADLTWVDDSTLRITPRPGAVGRAMHYRVTVGESARSAEGLSFESPARLDIQTVGFLEVGDVFPAPDADAIETNSVITVFFNRPVVPLMISEDMSGLPDPLSFEPDVPGTGEWTNTSIYTWIPSEPLAGSQTYQVSVEAGLEDQTGGVLESTYTWGFTTLPPEIVTVEPSSGATDFPLDGEITVTFNQAMNAASTQSAFSLVETNSGQAASGTFTWDETGRVMTFAPSGLLRHGGVYEVNIDPIARSASGQATLIGPTTWRFATVAAPAVVSTSPSNGEQDAELFGIVLYFASPMDEDSLEDKLTVDPALPEEATIYYNSYNNSLSVSGGLEPSTPYTVTLEAGAADPYGFTIDQPYTFTFTTGPLPPLAQLSVRGTYGLYDASQPTEVFLRHRNVDRVDFQLSRLSLDEFRMLTGSQSYQIGDTYTPSPDQIVRSWTIQTDSVLNEDDYVRVPLASEEGGTLDPGLYLLTVRSPDVVEVTRHLMAVVTANLTLKTSFDEALVWLTDLQSGQPLRSVDVTLYSEDAVLGQGSTGADGTSEIAIPHQDNLWDARYAVAEGNGEYALAMSEWEDGISAWEFGVGSNYQFQDYALYVYTDRPLYRPGQEVFFRGVLRDKNDVSYSLPSRTSVSLTIYNDQGDIIDNQALPVSEMGTFNGSLKLDDDASLGYYGIEIQIGELYSYQGFQVAEYRRPEFTVNVEPARSDVLAGDTVEATVDAEFFFGGPVSDADVMWSVLADTYIFDNYQGPGNYQFSDYSYDEAIQSESYVPGYGEVIANGTGKTDENGKFTLSLPASLDDSTTGRRLTIEAVVEDVNGITVAGRAEVIVHKGEYYVGVRPDAYVGSAGEEQSASLIVVDLDGQTVPNQEVTVEVVEQRWYSVQEEDEYGRTQWTWSVEETPVGDEITAQTDGQGRASINFTLPEGGTYKIRATVRDEAGRANVGSAYMWVYGGGFVSWRQTNSDRIDLIADKDSYEPGDTAEVLITSPFEGNDVRALVSIERGSILSHEVITLRSNSTVYEVPITGELAPDVFVSVVLVKGVDADNPVPEFRMGLVELKVDPVEQTIQLTVTPDSEQVGPGEEVTYQIKAADFSGRPVDAEVSLALVDLATLSLAPANSGPIVDAFYGQEWLGVRTSVPLIYLVDRISQVLIDRGKGGGGGGGEGFFDVRTEFEDTAYWSAQVRTGDDGLAEVSITLPDNLTTWRMDARAVTADTLVGQAEVDIVATRPLLIRPQTPRFLVADDEVTLVSVVNNNTSKAIDAAVSLEAQGVTILGNATQQVNIPAGGRQEVEWPAVVDSNVEWVDLVFRAEGGGLSDASKPPLGDPAHSQMLPVYRYEVPEIVGTAGQLVGEEARLEGIALSPLYDITRGQLTVQVDPSLAASITDGLTWLEHYQYECTEQTVSRFLPNALTLQIFRRFGLSDERTERHLEEQVGIGLQKLYAQQHVDGGWGWFVSGESNPLVTAYVIQGMIAARDAGAAVEERVINDGVSYLTGELESLDSLSAQYALNRQAYLLYVLAQAGQPDVSRTVQMYEARSGLQYWARALLAQTMWMIDPTDTRVNNIQSDLANAAILSATGAHWEEESDDVWNWNTDTRTTAIVLDTFAQLWPEHDLAPNVVRWLMVAREGDHWQTTQETAWALIGLTHWMAQSGELEPDYRWEVELNGRQLSSGQATPQTVRESDQIVVDVSEMLSSVVNRLSFERTEGPGRLYYTAHLEAYLPVEEVEPLSRGVIVSRRYLNENGVPVSEGRVGDILTVELNIVAPHDLYYVVVTDPYPAGAEAVDTGLQTESVLGERPTLQPDAPLARGWGWWWFSETDLRDEQAVMFADTLPAGTYQYTYQIRLGAVGRFRVIPPTALEFYTPEVFGRGGGSLFTIRPE